MTGQCCATHEMHKNHIFGTICDRENCPRGDILGSAGEEMAFALPYGKIFHRQCLDDHISNLVNNAFLQWKLSSNIIISSEIRNLLIRVFDENQNRDGSYDLKEIFLDKRLEVIDQRSLRKIESTFKQIKNDDCIFLLNEAKSKKQHRLVESSKMIMLVAVVSTIAFLFFLSCAN